MQSISPFIIEDDPSYNYEMVALDLIQDFQALVHIMHGYLYHFEMYHYQHYGSSKLMINDYDKVINEFGGNEVIQKFYTVSPDDGSLVIKKSSLSIKSNTTATITNSKNKKILKRIINGVLRILRLEKKKSNNIINKNKNIFLFDNNVLNDSMYFYDLNLNKISRNLEKRIFPTNINFNRKI